MKVLPLDINNNVFWEEIINTLQQGKSIVYPTDTIYGLGVNALDKVAVDRLFRIKRRAESKPMSVIIRDIPMARKFAYVNTRTEKILKAILPGPITVVLSRKDALPSIVSGGKSTIGIRIPSHEFTDGLTRRIDFPLTSTSVNISGEPPLKTIPEIIKLFEAERFQPDIIIDAGEQTDAQPSTVIDLTTSKPKILRVGPVKPEVLLKILEI